MDRSVCSTCWCANAYNKSDSCDCNCHKSFIFTQSNNAEGVEMTDKDILEEAKEYWAYDSESKKSRVTMTQEKYYAFKLIEEVEKLRDPKNCYHSKQYINNLRYSIKTAGKKIDSLTKELASANDVAGRTIRSLMEELAAVKKERDELLNRQQERGTKLLLANGKIKELEAENEEAKGDRDHQKANYHRLLGEMFRNEPMRDLAKKEKELEAVKEERDSLKTMIKLWEKRNRENAEAIEKLEAENKELVSTTKSLNDKMCWWKGEHDKSLTEIKELKAKVDALRQQVKENFEEPIV